LGIELELRNIEPFIKKKKFFASPLSKITRISPFINRSLYKLFSYMSGETVHVSFLWNNSGRLLGDERGASGPSKRWFLNLIGRFGSVGIDARHIHRRRILEREATIQNLLLIGAANRSELLIGWFVKGGVDDLPIQPLSGLYKTQVRQLAAFLGLPDKIRTQAPSPDMVKGITDEFALDIPYSKIDLALCYLEHRASIDDLAELEITKRELSLVHKMNQLSKWMRESPNEPPL
jgi:NAD+ synthase